MAIQIWPSANDIHGGTPGQGNKYLEKQAAAWIKVLAGQNFVIGGLTLPASDPDLTITVQPGTAWIDGRTVTVGAAENVTLTANQTNHIFLKMIKDGGGLANDAQFEANTTGTPPADSVKIGTAVAGASAVSSTTDARVLTNVTLHNHQVPQSGGALTTVALKLTTNGFNPAFQNTDGLDTYFSVVGQRQGDFRILPSHADMGEVRINQVNLAGETASSQKFHLTVDPTTGTELTVNVSVTWDTLDTA